MDLRIPYSALALFYPASQITDGSMGKHSMAKHARPPNVASSGMGRAAAPTADPA